jgi:hypothetical protein
LISQNVVVAAVDGGVVVGLTAKAFPEKVTVRAMAATKATIMPFSDEFN